MEDVSPFTYKVTRTGVLALGGVELFLKREGLVS